MLPHIPVYRVSGNPEVLWSWFRTPSIHHSVIQKCCECWLRCNDKDEHFDGFLLFWIMDPLWMGSRQTNTCLASPRRPRRLSELRRKQCRRNHQREWQILGLSCVLTESIKELPVKAWTQYTHCIPPDLTGNHRNLHRGTNPPFCHLVATYKQSQLTWHSSCPLDCVSQCLCCLKTLQGV